MQLEFNNSNHFSAIQRTIIRQKVHWEWNLCEITGRNCFRDDSSKSEKWTGRFGERRATLGDGSNECRVAQGCWCASPFGAPLLTEKRNKFQSAARLVIILAVYTMVRLFRFTPPRRLTPGTFTFPSPLRCVTRRIIVRCVEVVELFHGRQRPF